MTLKDLRQHKRWIADPARTVLWVRFAVRFSGETMWTQREAVVIANDVPHAMRLVMDQFSGNTVYHFHEVVSIVGVDIQE